MLPPNLLKNMQPIYANVIATEHKATATRGSFVGMSNLSTIATYVSVHANTMQNPVNDIPVCYCDHRVLYL